VTREPGNLRVSVRMRRATSMAGCCLIRFGVESQPCPPPRLVYFFRKTEPTPVDKHLKDRQFKIQYILSCEAVSSNCRRRTQSMPRARHGSFYVVMKTMCPRPRDMAGFIRCKPNVQPHCKRKSSIKLQRAMFVRFRFCSTQGRRDLLVL
jgi:hypothetical protein